MAKTNAIGFSFVVDEAFIRKIATAEEKLENLAKTSERTQERVIKAFQQMGSAGVDTFIRKLSEAQKALNLQSQTGATDVEKLVNAINKLSQASRTTIKINGIDSTSRQAKNAVDAINKLVASLQSIQNSGGQQFLGGVNILSRQTLNEMNRESRKMQRTFERLDQAIKNFGMSASELTNKLHEAREAQRQFNEIAKQQALQDVSRLKNQQGQYRTLNELKSYASSLKSTIANLDPKSKEWHQLNTILQSTNSYIRMIENTMKGVTTQTKNLIGTSSQLQRHLATAFSLSSIQGYFNELVSVRGEFELQQKALSAILQSKDQADKLWDQTVKLAVKSPFKVKELVSYTKQLAAYRIETDKLHETTKRLADVSAGLGVDMQRIILAYGQVRAASYLRGTELRQFTEAGIPMLEELARYFSELEGRAISVGDVFGMISKRLVSFKDVAEVFERMTDEGGVFYEMQAKQAETLKGMMSNLRDRIDLMLNDIGKVNDGLLKNMVSLAQSFVQNWKAVADQLELVIYLFGTYKIASLLAATATKDFGLAVLFPMKGWQLWAYRLALANMDLKNFMTTAKLGPKILAALKYSLNNLGLVVAGLGRAFMAMLPFAIITGLYELYHIMRASSDAAEELHKELDRIDEGLEKDLESSIGDYKALATTIRDVTKSYNERQKALETLKRTFGEILPSQMLELDYVLQLDDAYTNATTALKAYYEAKSRQQKFAKIDESFEDELSKDIKELYNDFADLYYEAENGLNYTIMETYGMDERHVKQVIGKLVEDVKKGAIDISNIETEFIQRLNKMFNVTIEIDKFKGLKTYYNHEIEDLTETLTRYRTEVDAVVGMDYDTIEGELHAKEAEKQSKNYAKLTESLNTLSAAYSNYYNAVQANKYKAELTDDDTRRVEEYRKDIENVYKSMGEPIPKDNVFSEITKSVFDIEREVERVSTIINNKFVGSLSMSPLAGENVALQKLINKVNDITKSFDGTNLQQVTERLYRELAAQYKIPLSAFDKLKVDGSTSVTDLRKNIENEIKAIKESIKAFDTALANQPLALKPDVALSEVEKAQGFTKEQIEEMRQLITVFTVTLNALGGGTGKDRTGRGQSIWEKRISIIKELRKEYDDLNKTFNKTTSKQKILEGYADAANEVFKGLGISITEIPFDNLDELAKFVDKLMNKTAKGSNDYIKLGKLKGSFEVEIETEDVKEKQEALIRGLEENFDKYELGLELKKLKLPKDLIKNLFDVDVLSLEDLREKIENVDTSAFGKEALKDYQRLLDKLNEMEVKHQEQLLKDYAEYLKEQQTKRVKIKMDELRQLAEIEKAFSFNEKTALDRSGADKESIQRLKDYAKANRLTIEQMVSMIANYGPIFREMGFTEEQINAVRDYYEAIVTGARLASEAVKEQSKKDMDEQIWSEFKDSLMFKSFSENMEHLSNTTLKLFVKRLYEMKSGLKELGPEAKSALNAIVEKAEKAMAKVNPFPDTISKIRQAYAGVNIEQEDGSTKNVRGQEGLTEEALAQDKIYKNSQRNLVVLESVKNANLDINQIKDEQIKKEAKSLGYGDKTLSEIDGLIQKEQKRSKLAKDNSDKLAEGIDNVGDTKDAIEETITYTKAWGQTLTGALDSVDALLEAFGVTEESSARLWINTIKQMINVMVQTYACTAAFVAMGVASKAAMGPIGWIAAAIEAIALLLTAIFSMEDQTIKNRIKDVEKQIKSLERSLEKLERQIEKSFSLKGIEQNTQAAIRNIEATILAYESAYQLEQSRKNANEDTLEQYMDTIDELGLKLEELKEDSISTATSGILDDTKDAAREFVDAWLEAFTATGKGLSGLREQFSTLMLEMVKQQASLAIAGVYVDTWKKELNKYVNEKDLKLTASEAESWVKMIQEQLPDLNSSLEQFFREMEKAGVSMEGGETMSGLQKGIQGISESQADIIAAYLNSIRFYVADSNTKLTQLFEVQTSDATPNPMLAQLKIIATQTEAIHTLLRGVVKTNHTEGGDGIKVFIN